MRKNIGKYILLGVVFIVCFNLFIISVICSYGLGLVKSEYSSYRDTSCIPFNKKENNPQCFGLQIGVSTLKECQEKYSLENRSASYLKKILDEYDFHKGKVNQPSIAERLKKNPGLKFDWYPELRFLKTIFLDDNATLYEIKGSTRFERNSNNYSESIRDRVSSCRVESALKIKDSVYLLLGFDKNNILNRVTFAFHKSRYSDFKDFLSEKYRKFSMSFYKSEENFYSCGETLIILSKNILLSSPAYITYIHRDEYEREKNLVAKQEQEKEKLERAVF